jgi:hypothetical protein
MGIQELAETGIVHGRSDEGHPIVKVGTKGRQEAAGKSKAIGAGRGAVRPASAGNRRPRCRN